MASTAADCSPLSAGPAAVCMESGRDAGAGAAAARTQPCVMKACKALRIAALSMIAAWGITGLSRSLDCRARRCQRVSRRCLFSAAHPAQGGRYGGHDRGTQRMQVILRSKSEQSQVCPAEQGLLVQHAYRVFQAGLGNVAVFGLRDNDADQSAFSERQQHAGTYPGPGVVTAVIEQPGDRNIQCDADQIHDHAPPIGLQSSAGDSKWRPTASQPRNFWITGLWINLLVKFPSPPLSLFR